MARLILGLPLVLAALLGAHETKAQELQCNAATAGALLCQRSTLCECQYFAGGAMSAGSAGYRWDCGSLRPQCAEEPEILAEVAPMPAPDMAESGAGLVQPVFEGIAAELVVLWQRVTRAGEDRAAPIEDILVGEGLSPVPDGQRHVDVALVYPVDGAEDFEAGSSNNWMSVLFARPERRIGKSPVPLLGHRFAQQAALAKEREIRLELEIAALQRSLEVEKRRTAALKAQRQDLMARNVVQWDRLLDMRDSHQAVLENVAEHTLYGIVAFEDTVAMTGLDVDKLLPNQKPKEIVAGQGGPFIPGGGSADSDPVQSVDTSLALLDIQVERWRQLQALLGNLPLTAPLDQYRVTSKFGPRPDPVTGKKSKHYGMDFKAALGTPVLNTAPGKIAFAGRKGRYGRMVEIDHGFGVHSRYAHLQKIEVKVGQQVGHRETIGLLGSSGRSTGAHVHYEVIVHRKHHDPIKFLEAGKHLFKNLGQGDLTAVAVTYP